MTDATFWMAVFMAAFVIASVLLDQWKVVHRCPYRGCPHKGRENE